jgi:phosphoribosylaminoimidazole-succinocarboxamide synthase
MDRNIVLETDLQLKVFRKGKVRDIYDLDDLLLMVTTDRISAFDYILPTGIPLKGKVLTGLSVHWFAHTRDLMDNHLITADVAKFPDELKKYSGILKGRSMLVRKTERIDIECVVRGYISGSAWKEYKEKGTVCGMKMPRGMKESDRFPDPIFTPAMKSDTGHDVNISVDEMAAQVGKDLTEELEEKSLRIYEKAAKKALGGNIIIADTKFEFGRIDGKTIIIDELLTPDSSRFWPLDEYAPGKAQNSFDKQFIRDWLEGIKWNKSPPAPPLPREIVEKTMDRYLEAYKRITGKTLAE